jgi:hypothetical protein
VVLCANGTAWTFPISGLPNNTLTTGSLPQPEQLPFTTGTTGAALMLPIGAVYADQRGAYLMDRGLSDQYLGAPVDDEITNNLEVIDIAVDREQRVYFTLGIGGAGGTSSKILVYDLIVGCWYTWTVPIAPVVAGSWKGKYVFADVSGQPAVWVLDDDEDSTFTDNGAAIITTVSLSSMSFGGPNGFEALWGGEYFGQYEGPHMMNIAFTYDNDTTPAQTLVEPVGTDPVIYRYEFRQDQRKNAAVAVTFEDSFTWPTLATITSNAAFPGTPTQGYALKVSDTSPFKVGDTYRTFVGTTLDAGTFTVIAVNAAANRIYVQTADGWAPINARAISYNTDSLLPGNSFHLEAVTLRVGVKTGMDKLPTNRRVGGP